MLSWLYVAEKISVDSIIVIPSTTLPGKGLAEVLKIIMVAL